MILRLSPAQFPTELGASGIETAFFILPYLTIKNQIYQGVKYTIMKGVFSAIFCTFSGLIYPRNRVNMLLPKGENPRKT